MNANKKNIQEREGLETQTPGSILKAAREDKGLSLESIHEVTKIPMDALRAIEEGYTVRTLSAFYYKGFLKIYATYLNIDVSKVIEDYKKEELPAHIKEETEGFGFREWVSRVFTRKRKQQLTVMAGIILSLFLIFKIVSIFVSITKKIFSKESKEEIVVEGTGGYSSEKKKRAAVKQVVKSSKGDLKKKSRKKIKKTTEKPLDNAAKKRFVKVASKATPPETAKAAIAVSPPVSVKKARKNAVLTVRAKKRIWLRVTADNVVVFQSILRAGAVETWMADERIELSGKNINQLEFEVNGKMIGTLGRKDRNAKKVIVTKQGLTVNK